LLTTGGTESSPAAAMDAGGHGLTADTYNDFLFGGDAGAVTDATGVLGTIAAKMPASFAGTHDAELRQLGMDFGSAIRHFHSRPLPQGSMHEGPQVMYPYGEGPEAAGDLMKRYTAMLQHQADSPLASHLDVPVPDDAPLWWEGARGAVGLSGGTDAAAGTAGTAAGLKVAKAGVLVAAGSLFSKLLGLGLLGYVAAQAMDAVAGKPPKAEEEHATQAGPVREPVGAAPPGEAAVAA
ncbi:unnamed protein product, partial [Prorocentrum cordatum]